MIKLGNKISEYRKIKGMTQEDLAAHLNVSSQAVSKWESDLSTPELPLLIEIADLFQVSLDELVRQKEKTKSVNTVEKTLKKPFNQMILRIVANSSDGDKAQINLPMLLVKAGSVMGLSIPEANGKEVLKEVDLNQILTLVEQGLVGKLVEAESADGNRVEIFVE